MRRRLTGLTPAQRRYLVVELALAAVLITAALLLRGGGTTAHFIAVVCLGYAVGLVAHPIAVVAGWTPRRGRRPR